MVITDIGKSINATAIKQHFMQEADAGILWLAVGSGNSSWDNNPQSPATTTTKLVNEVGRFKVSSSNIKFVTQGSNPDEDVISENPTNLLRISSEVILPESEIREYGLYTDGASTADSGKLYLYGTNPLIRLNQLNMFIKYLYIQLN